MNNKDYHDKFIKLNAVYQDKLKEFLKDKSHKNQNDLLRSMNDLTELLKKSTHSNSLTKKH